MKAIFKFLTLLAIIFLLSLAGCSTISQIEKKGYDDGMAYAQGSLEHESYDSGFWSCAMSAKPLVFPVAVWNATDLNDLVNNPIVATGIAMLDDLARNTINPNTKLPYWNQFDWAMGCVNGTKTRMTVSEVIAAIRVAYPQITPFLPAFGK